MATTIKDSGDDQRRVFRVCHECRAKLDVTYLIPKRNYACAECGFPFQHHPALAAHEVSPGEPRSIVSRLIPSLLAAAFIPPAIAFAFDLKLELDHQLAISGVATLLAALGILWARRLSKDPAGIVMVILTLSGFATLAMMMLRIIPTDVANAAGASDQSLLETRLTMTAVALIGIGGFSFARFMRNRNALVRVNADGKVSF